MPASPGVSVPVARLLAFSLDLCLGPEVRASETPAQEWAPMIAPHHRSQPDSHRPSGGAPSDSRLLPGHFGDEVQIVVILYVNWRGEEGVRRILPRGLRFAATEWHPDAQWLLDAFDLDKQAEGAFAL